MYVCLCNGYRDSEISEAARGGERCAKRAYFAMGNGPRCGQCLEMAQDIIDDVHEAESSECSSYPLTGEQRTATEVLPAGGSQTPTAPKSRISFSKA